MTKSDEKMYTIKIKKDSKYYRWMENQDKYTQAFKDALDLIISKFGEGNLNESKGSILQIESEKIGVKTANSPRQVKKRPQIKGLGMLTKI